MRPASQEMIDARKYFARPNSARQRSESLVPIRDDPKPQARAASASNAGRTSWNTTTPKLLRNRR